MATTFYTGSGNGGRSEGALAGLDPEWLWPIASCRFVAGLRMTDTLKQCCGALWIVDLTCRWHQLYLGLTCDRLTALTERHKYYDEDAQ